MTLQIPDKLYFKIGEVAEFTGIKPHVLRFWESEFARFRPAKSRNQQRLYCRKDIELVLHLKDLLYNQGFTISGAKKKIALESSRNSSSERGSSSSRDRLLDEVLRDLKKLRLSLEP